MTGDRVADVRIEPTTVVQMVESYVDDEIRNAIKFENHTPLDESGVFALHTLAARIYAEGYRDGGQAEGERMRRERYRRRESDTDA